MQRWLGFVFVVVSAVSFGAMGIFARFAYADGADPITVLTIRFVVASLTMLAIMAGRRIRWPRGRLLVALVLLGAICYVGQSLSLFLALTYASPGLVALLLYLYPPIVTLLAAVLLHERLTPIKLLALFLALSGSVLTIGQIGGGRLPGVLLGITSSLIYSIYIISGSRVTPQAGSIASSSVIMSAAAVVYVIMSGVWTLLANQQIVAPLGVPRSSVGWLAIVAIALISTVVAIVTFFAGMERIGPVNASTLSTLEPLTTVLLSTLVLDETIGTMQLIGGALIMVAVLLLARGSAPKPRVRVYS